PVATLRDRETAQSRCEYLAVVRLAKDVAPQDGCVLRFLSSVIVESHHFLSGRGRRRGCAPASWLAFKIHISFAHRRSHQRSSGGENADHRGQRNIHGGHRDLSVAASAQSSVGIDWNSAMSRYKGGGVFGSATYASLSARSSRIRRVRSAARVCRRLGIMTPRLA